MRLLCVAVLLCSIAFVAYADELQAMLAQDSPVAAYAFDKASFIASTGEEETVKGYTNRHKKQHKHGKHKSTKYGKSKYEDEDSYYKKDSKHSKYDDSKDKYESKYEDKHSKYEDKHSKYEDKHSKYEDKHESKYDEDKHSKYEDKYSEDKYGKDKYSDEDKYGKDKYSEDKYGPKYEDKHYEDKYEHKYGSRYGPKYDEDKYSYKYGKDKYESKYDEDRYGPPHRHYDGPGSKGYYHDGPGYEHYGPEMPGYYGPESGPEYYGDGGYYEEPSGHWCLQEDSRVPSTFPNVSDPSPQTFKSYFSCCTDYEEVGSSVMYCNFTATSNQLQRLAGVNPELDAQKGTVSASCMFTADGPCVPKKMLNKVFKTDDTKNHTYWLVVDAALANKAYPFGVYTAGAGKASIQSAEPMAARPAYSEDGEYEYSEPASYDDMDETVLGEVTQFSAYLASSAGLLKGGSIDFTAGFVDEDGNILCPTAATVKTTTAPTVGNGAVPLVKCGQLRLKLWYAPEEGHYRGYDGVYRNPDRYYDDYSTGSGSYSGDSGSYSGDPYSGPSGGWYGDSRRR